MGNTSPAREALRICYTWPQIWRIGRQEVASQRPHPVRSGKLRGSSTTGSCMYLSSFDKAYVDTGIRCYSFFVEICNQMPWSAFKNCKDTWNLVGWVTPQLSRSRSMNLSNLILTKHASGGSDCKHPPFSTRTFSNHTLRTKVYYFYITHSLDSRTYRREYYHFSVCCTISHRSVPDFFPSPIAAQE